MTEVVEKGEIKALKGEAQGELKEIRGELKAINTRIDEMDKRVFGEIRELRESINVVQRLAFSKRK